MTMERVLPSTTYLGAGGPGGGQPPGEENHQDEFYKAQINKMGIYVMRRMLPYISTVSIAFVLILTLLSSGCTDTGKTGEETVIGTILYVKNDNGTYIIQAENGTRYAPVNLDEEYQIDGMVVGFRGVTLENDSVAESPGIPIEIHYIGTYVPPGANATLKLEKQLP